MMNKFFRGYFWLTYTLSRKLTRKLSSGRGRKYLIYLLNKITPRYPLASIFEYIYSTNVWRGTESVSGESSSMKRTQSLRDALPYIVKKYEIKTFLDAPCGDFHWMKALAPTLAIHYIGADIVKDLIAANQARYKNENVTFITIDLTKNLFPEADILFCRDCLFHLSYRDIAMVFRNFINSNCRFLMTTSHINKSEFKNSDIKTGDWRWFDLFQEPFKFPQNYIEAVIDGGGDRYMYLWRKEDIASAIEGFMQNCLN